MKMIKKLKLFLVLVHKTSVFRLRVSPATSQIRLYKIIGKKDKIRSVNGTLNVKLGVGDLAGCISIDFQPIRHQ